MKKPKDKYEGMWYEGEGSMVYRSPFTQSRVYLTFYVCLVTLLASLGFNWVWSKWLVNHPLLRILVTGLFAFALFQSLYHFPGLPKKKRKGIEVVEDV